MAGQSMRIAWFSDTWLPTKDGVVNSLLSFKEELERCGHDIFLFVPSSETKNDTEHRLFFYRSKPFHHYPDYRMPPLHTLFSTRTRCLIANIQPDVIHAHSPGVIGLQGLVAAHHLNLPLLFTYHTFLQDSIYLVATSPMGQYIIRRLLLLYLRWFFRQCQGIIVPSQAAKTELAPLICSPVRVIPTGIDIARFAGGHDSKSREQLGVGNAPMILHVGRVVKEKNLDDLIAAAPLVLDEIPTAVFVIVGTGPYGDMLHRVVKKNGLDQHILFTGFIADENLPDYYAAADVFAFPSTYETQGIVALEAMAAGTPVVAARSRSLPELVEDGSSGYLFSPRNPTDLADKLVKALKAEDITSATTKTADRYSQQRCTERLLNFYAEFV